MSLPFHKTVLIIKSAGGIVNGRGRVSQKFQKFAYAFIALDIFQKIVHNKGIRNKLEAWLIFFCAETPEDIVTLLEGYPEFQKLYGEIYELCRNVEKVIGMFSKELQELDRNTAQYMMDEMQDEIDEQKALLKEKTDIANEQKRLLEEKDREIARLKEQLERIKHPV